MKAKTRSFSPDQPAVNFTGEFNSCPICSKLPRYTRSSCGGYHLGCCGMRTDSCVSDLTKPNANLLREEWNTQVINSELSPLFAKKYNIENGDLIIVKAADSSIYASFDNMDDALACLKQESKKNFSADYDLTQLVRIPNGNFIVAHIATSKILSYVGNWDGFNMNLMVEVD